MRSKYQLIDSASYFFQEIDRIAADGYIPNVSQTEGRTEIERGTEREGHRGTESH